MNGVGESALAAARDLRVVFSRLRRRLRDLAIGDDLTPSLTAVLTRLWKEGASSASALAEDRQRQVVSLTEAGRQRAESDRQVRQEWLARAMQERYSEPERRIILDALSLLERLTER
jgi:DNA-binding MarR family transcriptional regulator